jgi:hypothetical protein
LCGESHRHPTASATQVAESTKRADDTAASAAL